MTLHIDILFSWNHLLETLFSPLNGCLIENHLIICEGFIPGLPSLFHWYMSVILCQYQFWNLEVRLYFVSVQLLSHVWLFLTPWTAASQASLSIINSWSLLKLMSIESVMPSSHLTLCHPLLPLPSVFHSIRVFSNESVLRIRWSKNWSFSFNISPSNDSQDWSPLGWTGWMSLQSKGLSRVFSNTTVQKHQFFKAVS